MFNKKELKSILSALDYSVERNQVVLANMRREAYADKELIEVFQTSFNERQQLLAKVEKLIKEAEVTSSDN